MFTPPGSASSNLELSFSSSNTEVVTVSGNTLTILAAGTTTITASQPGNNNYNPALTVTRTLIINKKILVVDGAVAQSKTYDGNVQAVVIGSTLNGVVVPDIITLENGDSGTFAQSDVGLDIPVVTAMTISGDKAGNYILEQPAGLKADITQRVITVTAQDITTDCAQPELPLSYTFDPSLVGNDAFVGSLSREAGDNTGVYQIYQGTLSLNENYTLNFTGATFTITDNPPVWTTSPGSLDLTLEYGDSTGLVDAQNLAPVAFDACDDHNITPVKVSGQFVPNSGCDKTGKYTNNWTATDSNGNVVSDLFTQVITIMELNQPPVIDSIKDVTVYENAGQVIIPLSGIDPVSNCVTQQVYSIIATAVNDTLITGIQVDYNTGESFGKLIVKIANDMSGESLIRIRLKDNGGTEFGGIDTVTITFIVNVNKITGMENIGQNLDAKVYPNPARDYLTLEVKDFELSDLNYQLFDINGKLLQNEHITGSRTSISMRNLVSATYFVKVMLRNKEVKTFKIIKN